jgi:hypothetical protein
MDYWDTVDLNTGFTYVYEACAHGAFVDEQVCSDPLTIKVADSAATTPTPTVRPLRP